MTDKPRAAIFIDAANYFFALKDEGWRIDYERFLGHFKATCDVRQAFYYEGVPSIRVFFDSNPTASHEDFNMKKARVKKYHKRLKDIGFTVRSKPVGRLYDRSAGKPVHKCNFDVEITVDALDCIDDYDVCILGSGDGDFDKLVRHLKGKFKQVTVVAHKSYLSSLLRPNKTILLNDLRGAVEITWAQP
ncbi:NYN domain-containing protein [Candidatus Bipolaricaulota bacterium]|nr:NYN domain-containing protein [Candidatus Bipolaricaulota bacterium]